MSREETLSLFTSLAAAQLIVNKAPADCQIIARRSMWKHGEFLYYKRMDNCIYRLDQEGSNPGWTPTIYATWTQFQTAGYHLIKLPVLRSFILEQREYDLGLAPDHEYVGTNKRPSFIHQHYSNSNPYRASQQNFIIQQADIEQAEAVTTERHKRALRFMLLLAAVLILVAVSFKGCQP